MKHECELCGHLAELNDGICPTCADICQRWPDSAVIPEDRDGWDRLIADVGEYISDCP